ncbi:MAG TPA: exodeoxyribonuclease VII large subunit, partial [Acidimicrobiia bacterium]|nr:exodeoxyribonuclease VII large subunit [Acidimicrobiia bacterium]
ALRAGTVTLDGVDARVRALDPHRVLERGYTITRDEQGALVRTASSTGAGKVLVTETADGRVRSRVEEP